MKENLITTLIAIAGFILLSFSDAGIKLGSPGFSTFQVAATVAFFSLLPISIHLIVQKRILSPAPDRPFLMIIRSLLRIIQMPCMFYSFAHLPLSLVYAAIFAMPLAITALTAIVLRERIGPMRGIAILLGFLGVLVALQPSGLEFGITHWALFGIVICGAIDGVIVRHTSPYEPISVMGFWPAVNVVLAMGLLSIEQFRPMPAETIYLLAGTAFFSWSGGLLFLHAMRRGPVINASAMQYTQILWAGAIGYFMFDEDINAATVAGSLIIVACGLFLLRSDQTASQPAVDPNRAAGAPTS